MIGTLSVLNVGAGDTKLSFDPNNPQERIRAARIVKDMLRRGYALLIEVDDPANSGQKKLVRAVDFSEEHCEYIIADLDPDQKENHHASPSPTQQPQPGDASTALPAEHAGHTKSDGTQDRRYGPKRKGVPAESTKGTAVARIAGG